jgi:hypothetical protein
METNRESFLKKYNLPDKSYSLKELSQITKVPLKALQEVYNRGTGAYETNLSSVRLLKDFSKNPDITKYPASARLSKEAWSFARVYSFLNKSTTYKTTDSDIVKKYKIKL